MALVLDTGGWIAIDRLDRKVGAILQVAQQERVPVRTSAAVVAQVWRNASSQANLARVLAGVDTISLDGTAGRTVGEILALSHTSDVVDGHLGLIVRTGDIVLTSDVKDIKKILDVQGVDANVRRV